MSALLLPEVLVLRDEHQVPLPLAADGIQRYVWESRFGSILIEVVGEQTFVNGSRVEPAICPPSDH
jgi:hypothetical protein